MKRIIFWLCFIVVLGLIVWGLVVAMNKPVTPSKTLSTPADVTSIDNIIGPENARVTLIEYSDFQCPACAMYFPVVEKLFAESSTTMRLVYRHFPLPQHANAMIASQASEAAALQGKFWPMYRLIFDNQTEWENSTKAREIFTQYAERIGLNMTSFKKDIDSDIVKNKIQASRDEGIKIGINGTPTFFVNGKAISNPQGYEQFKTIIEEAIKNSTK
jgi:protein-disulfide isomerase